MQQIRSIAVLLGLALALSLGSLAYEQVRTQRAKDTANIGRLRQQLSELREQCAALTLEQADLRCELREAVQLMQGRGRASLQAWEPSWAADAPRTPGT